MVTRGENFCIFAFSIAPTSITGLGHAVCEFVADCLESLAVGGSARITAVAGTVLGKTNVPMRSEAKTETTTAPLIPATSKDTSLATTVL